MRGNLSLTYLIPKIKFKLVLEGKPVDMKTVVEGVAIQGDKKGVFRLVKQEV